jgi:hypothetical protein
MFAARVVSCVTIAGGAARAQSAGSGHGAEARGAARVLAAPHPETGLGQATLSDNLNGALDQYDAFKKTLSDDAGIAFAAPVSVFGQWGAPNGGPGVAEVVYAPSVVWTPFSDTAIGSGAVTFAFQGNQFWTHANSESQQARMGLLTTPNGWAENGYQYSQITYTHTLPGNWLAVSAGQYSFGQYDANAISTGPQTSFINYALSQNGTQAYANAGVGATAQVSPPGTHLQVAGGLQGATDITGGALTTNGLGTGSIAWFASAQWTPPVWGGGSYGVLYYSQPAVPQQPSASQGVSFSAAQTLDARYGVFLRVSNASGDAIAIETSVAVGGVVNDPFGRNQLDQAGLGFAWNKTNLTAVDAPARRSEQLAELYCNFTVFKALQVTPDVQVTIHPALAPQAGIAAVFGLRTTVGF